MRNCFNCHWILKSNMGKNTKLKLILKFTWVRCKTSLFFSSICELNIKKQYKLIELEMNTGLGSWTQYCYRFNRSHIKFLFLCKQKFDMIWLHTTQVFHTFLQPISTPLTELRPCACLGWVLLRSFLFFKSLFNFQFIN